MIITKTPYRISFFGGGSDYPEWYKKFGGSVLSTTIDKHIYISCRLLPNTLFRNELKSSIPCIVVNLNNSSLIIKTWSSIPLT